MSVSTAVEDPLFRRIRNASLAYVGLSRIVLAVLMVSRREPTVGGLLFTIGWGLPPYIGLLLTARWMGARAVFAGAVLLVAASEAVCWLDALNAARSTAALGVFLQPIYATVLVIPAALVVGWLLRGLTKRRGR